MTFSSYFLIFPSYFFIFLGLGKIPSCFLLRIQSVGKKLIFLHILHIFFISLGLRKIPSFSLGPGIWKNSDLSIYIWALGLRKNTSLLIYGRETCFYCRVLDGNLFLLYHSEFPLFISIIIKLFNLSPSM